MSRIGKQPVAIPESVTVSQDGDVLRVKGPKAELRFGIPEHVQVAIQDKEVNVTVSDPENADQRAKWGLVRALIANMVHGVTQGFERKLEINGVGYRAQLKGKDLELFVGFSHSVVVHAEEGVQFSVDGNVITVSGADRQRVGELAAMIRRVRKPEPYKGKGIKYQEEQIRRKAGKVVKAAGGE
ncbi:MAG: 50S ribosomal protein L6 [Candidatus Kerfeldbacteria bacterium]|nr:50S ribosomal protein L6 [Candidatus Kerfeldbacteria bacterium]